VASITVVLVSKEMKKYVEYEMEHARPRGRQKRTWREFVQKKTVKHVN